MATPSEIEAQVRFALTQLPVHNAHHEFEHICRRLAQQYICSNILPATGPVSAGGDQGRDFETFRTYLREELGSHGAFLGLVSEGAIAFICTTQDKALPAKLKGDIKKVCASGHPVHEIRAFTLESVPAAARHKLESETQESHNVRLEFHDAESIANLLARPEGFWIAERHLSIPAEIRPEAIAINTDLSTDYVERRQTWRERGSPNPSLGDFIDLKAGLRMATHHPDARGDLPFWIGLVREFLSSPELSPHIKQRARYELVVATLRGTSNFRTVDEVARVYLEESVGESDPARLEDASTLLLFANAAVRAGLTSLMPSELGDWNSRLTSRIQSLVDHETPHRRATLLFSLGYLGLHPNLLQAKVQDSSDEVHESEGRNTVVGTSTLAGLSLPDGLMPTNVSRTLSAWTTLMETLEETPLFPIQSLADILQLLVPLWSRNPEWRELLDSVEVAVGQRVGKSALASRARDRAMMLLQEGRHLDALEEFHRAKVDWWSGETVRGSLLAMIIIARLYLELRLPQASKSYALAVSYIAAGKGDEELADLIPAGLLMAAHAEFAAGAWCSATELYEIGLMAHLELVENFVDSEKHGEFEDAIANLAYISACARIVDSDLAGSVSATIDRIGASEVIIDAIDVLTSKDNVFWESFRDFGLFARPFADLGAIRHIHFSGLGVDWTLDVANDPDSVRIAERLAAATQVMLSALARDDLCLVQTHINVLVKNRQVDWPPNGEQIESLPSNDGRQWIVRLTPVSNAGDGYPEEFETELLNILTTILREASLLPDAEFLASIERAFVRGLSHKLSAGRPYDELSVAFAVDPESAIDRASYNTPWECHDGLFTTHDELRWQDGPGPTFSQEMANEMLRTRYVTLAKCLRITVIVLASSEEFRPTVEALRARGWLDWHILGAVFNTVLNYRLPANRFHLLSEETRSEHLEAAMRPESATEKPVPVGLFDLDVMNRNRQLAMLSLLKHWGLECRQRTPDLRAIERLLAGRYGYWDDDVPHDDPFPDPKDRGNTHELMVIKDLPPLDNLA